MEDDYEGLSGEGMLRSNYERLGTAWHGKVLLGELRLWEPSLVEQVWVEVFYINKEDSGVMECANFTIRWYESAGEDPMPRLNIFYDAWEVFSYHPEIIEALFQTVLNDDYRPSPEEVCRALESLGLENHTQYEPPSDPEEDQESHPEERER